MDALSEALSSVRMTGAIFLNAEFTAPLKLRSPARLAGGAGDGADHQLSSGDRRQGAGENSRRRRPAAVSTAPVTASRSVYEERWKMEPQRSVSAAHR
jgi:hypothetical protein